MPGVLLFSQPPELNREHQIFGLMEPVLSQGQKKGRKRSFSSSARLKSGCQEPHPSSPPLDIEIGTFLRCPDTFCEEKSYSERSGCSWAPVALSLPTALNKNVFFNMKRAGTRQDGNDLCHQRIQGVPWVERGFSRVSGSRSRWDGVRADPRGTEEGCRCIPRLCWRLECLCFTFPPSPPSWESVWVCQRLGKHFGRGLGILLRSYEGRRAGADTGDGEGRTRKAQQVPGGNRVSPERGTPAAHLLCPPSSSQPRGCCHTLSWALQPHELGG